uniref:Predicted protein n=1 Tax=Physcomitrium patens TaxID=3218 RepID=A9U5S6_PHYPA
MASTYPQFAPYQPPGVNTQELPMLPGLKETNEMLLLNLTKKMEELAVNMAKEKEKRPKQTNFRANVQIQSSQEDTNPVLQDSPVNHIEVVQAVQTRGQRNLQSILKKDKIIEEQPELIQKKVTIFAKPTNQLRPVLVPTDSFNSTPIVPGGINSQCPV